ncbi:MAG: SDR family oxidoreductase [Bacteroidota bacterium]
MKRLEGQLAIITGGARGFGEGVCKVFLEAGATVALWDVLDEGAQTAQNLSSLGEIFFQNVNITSKESVDKAVAEIMEKYGHIEILINNAGIIRDRSFMKMTDDEWNAVVHVNLNGLYVTTKAVLPHMIAGGYGRIVCASSVNSMAGAFGQTNYSATKAATSGFVRSLCKEVGKHGITVNAVAPGFILTEMTKSMPQAVIDAGIAQIPVKRIGTPEDMGHCYLFLASKEAGFVSGITLHANGGVLPL